MKTAALFLSLALVRPIFPADSGRWVVTWSASPAPQLATEAQMRAAKLEFSNQTLREVVHTSIGSRTARIRLSNAYGKEPVTIGSVHVAVRVRGSEILPASDRAVTFSGRPSAMIPTDAPLLSDPVKLDVPPGGDLAISIFIPKRATGAGIHYAAQETTYIAPGNQTGAKVFPAGESIVSWVFLTGVDVLAPDSSSAVVAFGDSITDGAHSTVDANHRWPDFLARRLLSRHNGSEIGVVDAGIGGNRILHDAASNIRFGVNGLARFDRDVLAEPGVQYVIVLEGINDLGHPGTSAPASEAVTAEDLIAGLKQMIARAHERGLKIFGATLTPFAGAHPGYFTPEKEVQRKALNHWIRTSHAFDGVIDFEKAVRDPKNPDRMLPSFDSGDHLHPGDAGYEAMAQEIDLSLFQ